MRITKNFFRSTCILVMLKELISMDEIIVWWSVSGGSFMH